MLKEGLVFYHTVFLFERWFRKGLLNTTTRNKRSSFFCDLLDNALEWWVISCAIIWMFCLVFEVELRKKIFKQYPDGASRAHWSKGLGKGWLGLVPSEVKQSQWPSISSMDTEFHSFFLIKDSTYYGRWLLRWRQAEGPGGELRHTCVYEQSVL